MANCRWKSWLLCIGQECSDCSSLEGSQVLPLLLCAGQACNASGPGGFEGSHWLTINDDCDCCVQDKIAAALVAQKVFQCMAERKSDPDVHWQMKQNVKWVDLFSIVLQCQQHKFLFYRNTGRTAEVETVSTKQWWMRMVALVLLRPVFCFRLLDSAGRRRGWVVNTLNSESKIAGLESQFWAATFPCP